MSAEYSKFQSSSWSAIDVRQPMVPILSKNGPDMVQKRRHFLDMFVNHFDSLLNSRALADLKVKLDRTWSKHGPNMALTWAHKVDKQ